MSRFNFLDTTYAFGSVPSISSYRLLHLHPGLFHHPLACPQHSHMSPFLVFLVKNLKMKLTEVSNWKNITDLINEH